MLVSFGLHGIIPLPKNPMRSMGNFKLVLQYILVPAKLEPIRSVRNFRSVNMHGSVTFVEKKNTLDLLLLFGKKNQE